MDFKLETFNICKSYRDKKVLDNLSLSLKKGERLSILGPSGCGKSTFLGILSGITDDFEGSIILDGKDIGNLPANRRNIVVVSQENLLFPHMDVYGNIAFGLKARKTPKAEIDEKVSYLLSEMSLEGYEKKRVDALSGGEKQRVAIARALAVNPNVLLLDEAYSSLDTNLREKMRELTIRLQEKEGISTILVTHDREEAMVFSHRIAVMLDGRIMQVDSPENLYRDPVNISVAKFLISDNYFEKDSKTYLVKPEDIHISATGKSGKDVRGIIRSKKYLPAKTRYDVDTEYGIIRVENYNIDGFKEGEEVFLQFSHVKKFEK